VDAVDVGGERGGVAADDAPSDAPAGCQIILGQPAESDARNIRRNASERYMFFAVIENQLVVNFVGEN
jgi:hypothetical protein